MQRHLPTFAFFNIICLLSSKELLREKYDRLIILFSLKDIFCEKPEQLRHLQRNFGQSLELPENPVRNMVEY